MKRAILITSLGIATTLVGLAYLGAVKEGLAEIRTIGDDIQTNARALDTITLPNPLVSYGKASYYDYQLASGWSSVGHYVAASRDSYRQSRLRVTNTENGKSVMVTVTDFGPSATLFPERIVDLSSTAFAAIAPLARGVVPVKVEVLP